MVQRAGVLEALKEARRTRRPIVAVGAGTGLSAVSAARAGVDYLVVYNSGRYRMAGRGSLAGMMPYGDANATVVELGHEILPIVPDIPVIAGVCGTDPFRVIPRFVDSVIQMGFSGIQNFPTVGLIDGLFRANLEETGMSYALEVDMIRYASSAGLFTSPYVFTEAEATLMTAAGADVIVAHLGLTTSGRIGAKTAVSLDDAVVRVQLLLSAARAENPDVFVLCHGGPIAEPHDVQYVLDRVDGCDGFVGASSIERLATELAIEARAAELLRLNLAPSRVGLG